MNTNLIRTYDGMVRLQRGKSKRKYKLEEQIWNKNKIQSNQEKSTEKYPQESKIRKLRLSCII